MTDKVEFHVSNPEESIAITFLHDRGYQVYKKHSGRAVVIEKIEKLDPLEQNRYDFNTGLGKTKSTVIKTDSTQREGTRRPASPDPGFWVKYSGYKFSAIGGKIYTQALDSSSWEPFCDLPDVQVAKILHSYPQGVRISTDIGNEYFIAGGPTPSYMYMLLLGRYGLDRLGVDLLDDRYLGDRIHIDTFRRPYGDYKI